MRTSRTFVAIATLAFALSIPTLADAQSRGRAVPRGSVRSARPPVGSVRSARPAYRPSYRTYSYVPYRPGVSLGVYYGYGFPGYIGPYAYGYGFPYSYRYGYSPYGAYGYGSVYPGYARRAYGGVRLDLPQRDAEVVVDGYYAGVVDDFDGTFQQVDLEPGPHSIEVRLDGFETVSFEVNVEPGRTITYRSTLRSTRQ